MAWGRFFECIENWTLLDDVLFVNVGKASVGLVPSLVHGGSVAAHRELLILAATGTFARASGSLGFDDSAEARGASSGVIGGNAILSEGSLVVFKGEAWAFLKR